MQKEWFETFFQGPAVDFWIRVVPPSVTVAESDYLEKSLDLKPGSRILDLACGQGRHSIELARRGHQPTGIDLSDEMLAHARKSAQDAAHEIDWRHGDLRYLDLAPAAFDGAFIFGNSFGYLDEPHVRGFFAAVHAALQPGARLVIDNPVAAESILPALLAKRWHHLGDLYVLSECHYSVESSRLEIDYTFLEGGAAETRRVLSHVFTTAHLRGLLAESGFQVVSMHSGLAGEPYQVGTPRLLLTARRE